MKEIIILLFLTFAGAISVVSQVAINSDGSAPDNSAMLDVSSTTDGVLLTRMTSADRDAISLPETGLIIFNTEVQLLQVYNGSSWISFVMESCSPSQPGSIIGNSVPQPNSTGEVYSVNVVDGATSYNWTVPAGATITSGQGTTSINVNFGTTSGNVSVRAESGCGVSSYSDYAITLTSFSCGNQITDSRDGQSYSTVQIGGQCWMAENLNIGTIISGSSSQTDNSSIEKYCYSNNASNCDTYGGLYQWDEMMQYATAPGTQGICPTDWHIPTDSEWCTLENEVDAGSISCSSTSWRGIDAGGNLKQTGYSTWSSPNTGATNLSGFTALAAGIRYNSVSFYGLSQYTYWWSSNENSDTQKWDRHVAYTLSTVERNTESKAYGFSVRCIKD